MRFSVTFCALLLVTTTGIAQDNSRDLGAPADLGPRDITSLPEASTWRKLADKRANAKKTAAPAKKTAAPARNNPAPARNNPAPARNNQVNAKKTAPTAENQVNSSEVKTAGSNQASPSISVKPAGNNRADSSENAITALDDLSGRSWTKHYGLFLEKGDGGRGVRIAGSTAKENNFGQSNDPTNPGQIATNLKDKDVQLFVGTPEAGEQSVMASNVKGDGKASVTYFNLDTATHQLFSATVCDYDRPCLTITKKSCDSVFPKSSNFEQNLKKIEECGSLLGDLEKIHDLTAEQINLEKMREIRPGMKLSPSEIKAHKKRSGIVGQSSEDMRVIENKYHALAQAISFCRRAGSFGRAGSFERFVDPAEAPDSQSQNKSPGSAVAE